MRSAVARASVLEPQDERTFPVTDAALVIGGGVAGIEAALELADAVEFLGAQLGTSSTFDYSAVRLSTPVAKLPEALPLMADVVMRPSFPAAA